MGIDNGKFKMTISQERSHTIAITVRLMSTRGFQFRSKLQLLEMKIWCESLLFGQAIRLKVNNLVQIPLRFVLNVHSTQLPRLKISVSFDCSSHIPFDCFLCPHTQWCHLTALSVHIPFDCSLCPHTQ